ncbi:hypothetical protein MUK42_22091 [Musa troglodytarum]|uniref:Uncharacterized protein n=1 Tax=Musa troglodytarum TaxID=320322 RepID=A0A9E7G8J6_9LILI|nr:hypothetical protein MUK42_22091 [Musa troglodytarum]URE10483.1 hypothetical protein MUK42_22091 [Musa troglodytarum]URE10484.1 hypothetical protein MUK42_22091 [Musa troglodytarum]
METKPLTAEAIALTEKKMDMTLDDIIKMSKKNTSKGRRPLRMPIKSQGFQNGNRSQNNAKVQQFMDSRSSIRQGFLAQRRSNFQGNQFQMTTEIARKVSAMPIRNRLVNQSQPRAVTSAQRKVADGSFPGKKDEVVTKQKPETMDALFANMKKQRMRMITQQANRSNGDRNAQSRNISHHHRGRGGARRGSSQWTGNLHK